MPTARERELLKLEDVRDPEFTEEGGGVLEKKPFDELDRPFYREALLVYRKGTVNDPGEFLSPCYYCRLC